jgi:hypothetical protein
VETYDEWRLIFEVGNAKGIDDVIEEARAQTSEEVDIHRRGDQVLAYALSEADARATEKLVAGLLGARGLPAASTLTRWNPGAERWQDPSLPVEHRTYDIGPDWAAMGELAWEVRLRLQSGKEARRLAEELLDAGRPTISGLRNRITVGVVDGSEASALAEDLRLRAPTAEITVRPLSRWRRWLIRQRLVKDYAGGGDVGGDFGGGNGGGGGD